MITLVAEDDMLVAVALVPILGAGGHHVLGPAATAAEALALAGTTSPELVLPDINFENRACSLELAQQLRDRHRTAVLLIDGQAKLMRAHRDVALDRIHTPFSPAVVLRAFEILAQLKHHRQPRQIPPSLELFGRSGSLSPRRTEDRVMDGIWEQKARERAYAIWQHQGCPEGHAEQFWLMAEEDLLGEGGSPANRRPEQSADEHPAPVPTDALSTSLAPVVLSTTSRA